jgi:hypothetical protein
MSTETYANLRFSEEKIRLTVLTNICRMMMRRGYMDGEKYKKKEGLNDSNKQSINNNVRNVRVDPPSIYDPYDNDLFLPFIGNRVDNNTYIIPMDIPFRDQREANVEGVNLDFDGLSLIVKLIPQVVKDVSNSPILNDFFKSYNNNHKIVVFDGVADKVHNIIRKKKNIEVFDRDYLMIDLMSIDSAPAKCGFVTLKDIEHITNPKFSKIHENDPLARYYNAKYKDILHVERTSINNSREVGYRKVIEPKPVFN